MASAKAAVPPPTQGPPVTAQDLEAILKPLVCAAAGVSSADFGAAWKNDKSEPTPALSSGSEPWDRAERGKLVLGNKSSARIQAVFLS
ncbi:hypothetical protein DIPPA_03740 [Diplonema papillatum]|nr:hypothetical protein DIPPA_03740 [Diplonema papillatum]